MWIFIGAESFIVACILAAGVTDDLRSKKVHNYLIGILFLIALASMLIIHGASGLFGFGLSFATSLLLLPLFFFGVLGGGDIKLFMAITPLISWQTLLYNFGLSLAWGAVFGLFFALLNKDLLGLLTRISIITKHPTAREFSISRIPFTLAMLLGWLSYLALSYQGVL